MQVTQLVEYHTDKVKVGCSIHPLHTPFPCGHTSRGKVVGQVAVANYPVRFKRKYIPHHMS